MEEKNMNNKILKKLIVILLIIIIVCIIATIGIGNYFVDYAILRSGNGGDREVKNADSLEVAIIQNEDKRVIEENI